MSPLPATAGAPRVLIPARIAMPAHAPQGRTHTLGGACMGTSWQVRAVLDGHDTHALQADIAALLEEIEASMSHFRPGSELCRFAQLPAGAWLTLSGRFAHVLRHALEIARASQGAFDPALGEPIEAWGFGAGTRYSDPGFRLPASQTRPAGTWQRLELRSGQALQQPGGVRLNLSAIAKGYAVDAVCALLGERGIANHLVEIGGELRGAGMKPDLSPWWVALESPDPHCPLPGTRIALHGLAVATSGDYRRRYRAGTRNLQHTLDPITCAPLATGLASVSVIHAECMPADAWATAIMVRGARDGLALASEQGLAALLQWREPDGRWREAATPAFTALQSGH